MRKMFLGAAVVVVGLSMSAASAQAAEFGVYLHGPVAYVQPAPRPEVIVVSHFGDRYGYREPRPEGFVGGRERGHFEPVGPAFHDNWCHDWHYYHRHDWHQDGRYDHRDHWDRYPR